jgi:hypothetical protein
MFQMDDFRTYRVTRIWVRGEGVVVRGFLMELDSES